MSTLRISENILRMRREKKITQDQLAEFVGVTKASVSKWETGQSMPDILLLPQLAAFFDVTVDELLGYEPQLSKEQIKCTYHKLADAFAMRPFEEVLQESEKLVRKYYSCYPFLMQICVLWLNHYSLATQQERQQEILEKIIQICEHILENCKDIGICNDAVGVKAMVEIQCGRAKEVIESLEEMLNPSHMSNGKEDILIQAYLMTQELEKADYFTQIQMFKNILAVVWNGIQLMTIHAKEWNVCEKIMERIDTLIKIFQLETLHPNTVLNYQYQAAITNCIHGKKEEACLRLKKFVELVSLLLEQGITLHGDDFFYRLDTWFEELDLGAKGVRNEKLVIDSAIAALENPVFLELEQTGKVQQLKNILKKEREKL